MKPLLALSFLLAAFAGVCSCQRVQPHCAPATVLSITNHVRYNCWAEPCFAEPYWRVLTSRGSYTIIQQGRWACRSSVDSLNVGDRYVFSIDGPYCSELLGVDPYIVDFRPFLPF